MILLNPQEEIFTRVNMFHAQLVVSWKARCQVTFADYALNHPLLKFVVHKLSSDMYFAMVLTESLVVTVVSKIHIFSCVPPP